MTTICPRTTHGAIAGLVTGALATAIGMLLAAMMDVVSPIDAVGSTFIDHTPRWLKEWAIRSFGTDDKTVLRLGIVVVLALAAVVIGMAALRRRWAAWAGFAAFGVVGAVAAVRRPDQTAGAALPSIVGAIVGAVVLHRLVRPRPIPVPGESQAPLGWDRRQFLFTAGAAGAAAVIAGGTALAIDQSRIADVRAKATGPLPATGSVDTAAPIDAAATVDTATPFVTAVGDFYRIDTALSFPRADAAKWSLDITGMVDHPLHVTYAELLAMPQVERVVTLCCVSNEVGGEYVGNAVWRGVLLSDLLDRVGVRPGAEQVYSTSLDGWTCGFPVEVARDGRDAMIAVGMNGATLPLEHGYPARLVVPGLYGYVSATKWLRTIELTTWDRQGYWVPLGWSKLGPVKTQSRIDVPRNDAKVTAGPQKIAGVAWAQHRGIAMVEVKVDDGSWQQARLGTDVSNDAWRQWVLDWNATTGTHTIEVRATDKTGATQPANRTDVAPDGATGHHTIKVKVS
jgi:DMSO/TMAO reductase YedYZ molybdopterin-dependent catalytic subunit